MCPTRPPGLPLMAEVTVQLRHDARENKLWFEVFLVDGCSPTKSFGTDWATMPLEPRLESEWLSQIDAVFGSAILAVHRFAGRLPVCLPAEYDDLLEQEKVEQK